MKKNENNTVPDFTLYYRAIVSKTSMVLTQRQTHKLVELHRECRKKPTHSKYLIFNRDAKSTSWGNDDLLKKWFWENWISHVKGKKSLYKSQSKKDQRSSCKT